MRKLLGGLVIILLIVVAVGVWRGWFDFSLHNLDSNRPGIEMNIDKGKLESDTARGKQKLQEATEKAKEETEPK
jgi:hypothetical protein